MQNEDKKMKVTIGILTWNSEVTLRLALESVKDATDILISDGGSTDKTLEIAREYGARIISQTNPGKPIEDFSIERNNLLQNAKEDWFFYLDADEYISEEFKNFLVQLTKKENPDHYAYFVRYHLVSAGGERIYKSWSPQYQIRLVHKKTEATFIRPSHERLQFDRQKFPVGKTESSWFVPLDVQLTFSVYKGKVLRRFKVLAEKNNSKSPIVFLSKVFELLKNFFKQIIKMVLIRLRFGSKDLVPFKYDIYRLYGILVHLSFVIKRYTFLITGYKNLWK